MLKGRLSVLSPLVLFYLYSTSDTGFTIQNVIWSNANY